MKQLTVKDLYSLCEYEIKHGNADKKIVISDDNEGNGFHGLFYGFTPIKKEEKDMYEECIYDSQETAYNKIIVLG